MLFSFFYHFFFGDVIVQTLGAVLCFFWRGGFGCCPRLHTACGVGPSHVSLARVRARALSLSLSLARSLSLTHTLFWGGRR